MPENILLKNELNIDQSLSESEALKKLKLIAQKNETFRILLEWDIIMFYT